MAVMQRVRVFELSDDRAVALIIAFYGDFIKVCGKSDSQQ